MDSLLSSETTSSLDALTKALGVFACISGFGNLFEVPDFCRTLWEKTDFPKHFLPWIVLPSKMKRVIAGLAEITAGVLISAGGDDGKAVMTGSALILIMFGNGAYAQNKINRPASVLFTLLVCSVAAFVLYNKITLTN
jgi:hypothetical protein